MKIHLRFSIEILLIGLLAATSANAQLIRALDFDTSHGLAVHSFTAADGRQVAFKNAVPLFSCEVNDTMIFSALNATATLDGESVRWSSKAGIAGSLRIEKGFNRGWKGMLTISNTSDRKLLVSGVVPFGEGKDHVFIKAAGPSDYVHRLSRSCLFRPGLGPVGVVLPDNAWELGFCDMPSSGGSSLTAIARRTDDTLKADTRRFRTTLAPGGHVTYVIYADEHQGDWHEGLRMMFEKRWLYDLEKFDNTLFERKDLEWIRHSYLITLQFAWDHTYYDALQGRHGYDQFLTARDSVIGKYEAYMIWPTWPRLGLDQRNQWDMYRDLPGGLKELRREVEVAHKDGTRYFIAYNPWDESTRHEDHVKGMEEMLRTIDGDGVVLDTWGESSKEFQAAADRVKPGVILYSEGMAVPKDMPGIVAGRVHDAIYLPPPLNLNKLIKPDFAIFRVAQLAEGRIHRETAVAFFNGYGVEMNIMRPGRPDWIDEEFAYLGRTTKILRENSNAFLTSNWVPLIPTTVDSVWVNKWPLPSKTVYTVLSMRPEGIDGPLFEAPVPPDSHYISLWHHEEIHPDTVHGKFFVPAAVDGFSRAWLDSRREGNVDCIAMLPRLLKVKAVGDSLTVEASQGTKILIWAGVPAYNRQPAEFGIGKRTISLIKTLGRHEEKFVVQLFDNTDLLDERVVNVQLATPRLIARDAPTVPATKVPAGMSEISAGKFQYKTARSFLSPNEVIPYPGFDSSLTLPMPRYFIDTYPVTNEQFKAFLRATGYRPKDTTNFLKHWPKGILPSGKEKHPVVYVNLDDAHAFAKWAGKRLPTEIEWQYASQGTDGRKYPWGAAFDSTKCNVGRGSTTAVDAFPAGKSPFGVMDCVGNVWQWTGDVYDNGTFFFGMIRGGSFYDPTSSFWYIKGGPQPVDNPQVVLMVSPGFDRCGTVGFRCVKDAK
jgi:formylglycine-generating enzyme required for sulfatase activity